MKKVNWGKGKNEHCFTKGVQTHEKHNRPGTDHRTESRGFISISTQPNSPEIPLHSTAEDYRETPGKVTRQTFGKANKTFWGST